jgi:hypothetical protein
MDERTERYIASWVIAATATAAVPAGATTTSPAVPAFMTAVLVEAFNARRNEQPALVMGLSPARAVTYEEVSDALSGQAGNSVLEIMTEAAHNIRGDELQLIDVLEVINRRWCNVWPFCRATGSRFIM